MTFSASIQNPKSKIQNSRCGQAMLELAVFGSLMLMVLGALVNYGLNADASQRAMMGSFRQALSDAARTHDPNDPTPMSVSRLLIHDQHFPDPSNPFAVGSMVPTLVVGDLILVNKFHYGVRLPVINLKLIDNNNPQRGDVMVFRYPPKPSLDYIKRVVGVPGDEVAYLNKKLTVNGKALPKVAQPDFFDEDALRYARQFKETSGSKTYRLLNDEDRAPFISSRYDFPFKQNCRYSIEGVVCKVPEGHYFMMGDNRDNSEDSRYWGFVPEANIVGKAFFVWMNFGNLKRIGVVD